MPVLPSSTRAISSLACSPGKSKERFHDPRCKGLLLEVRSSGGKTWYVSYTTQRGQRREHRLGDCRDLTLSEARQLAEQHRHAAAMGRDPAEEKAALRQVPTLEAFVDDTFLPYIKITKSSWKQDLSLLRRHILPALGKKPLDAISRTDVLALVQRRIADGAAAGSVNRVVILLRYMFNQAIRWETPGVAVNPTKDVPLLKLNNQRQTFLSQEEASRLLNAVQQSANPVLGSIVAMLLLTGARKREVMDARCDGIDWKRRIWRIPISKSGRARYVPLSDGALLLLRQRQFEVPDGCPWIFPNPDSGDPYRCINNSWDTARRRAGMPELRIHDLRHSFASFLINNGRSLYEVQKILGHSSAKMTERYAHLAHDTLLAASNAASLALGGCMPAIANGYQKNLLKAEEYG